MDNLYIPLYYYLSAMLNQIRFSKICILFMLSMYMTLVVLNNVTDYGSNFLFVSNILSMSDVFSESAPSWRALHSETLHHIFYVMIIFMELSIAVLLAIGGLRLWRFRNASAGEFASAKKYGIYGLLLGLALWFTAFVTVAGEWFLMWQSVDWNGNPTAFRNSIVFLLVTIHVTNTND